MRYGAPETAGRGGVISFPVGTSQRLEFPLVYADASEGVFDEDLASADFFVGRKTVTTQADAELHRDLTNDITVEVIEGVRHLVVTLSPADTEGMAPGRYYYAAVIEWGVDSRSVIAKDVFILEAWPGHPAEP